MVCEIFLFAFIYINYLKLCTEGSFTTKFHEYEDILPEINSKFLENIESLKTVKSENTSYFGI